MIIKEGYNRKPVEIRIEGSTTALVWIKFDHDGQERLAYATLDELRLLKEEIDNALRRILNL